MRNRIKKGKQINEKEKMELQDSMTLYVVDEKVDHLYWITTSEGKMVKLVKRQKVNVKTKEPLTQVFKQKIIETIIMAKLITNTESVSNINISTCKICEIADIARAVEISHNKILELWINKPIKGK